MKRVEKNEAEARQNYILKNAAIVFLAEVIAFGVVACAVKENQLAVEDVYSKLAKQTNSTEVVSEYGKVSEEATLEETKKPEERLPMTILEEMGVPIPAKSVDFDKLRTTNGDIYAWIFIPDTEIDYPVLQHPEDNSYYLNYNLDGSKGYPGCIYTENYNNKNFSDPDTVLYGHNMKDGTMFAGLHNYGNSEYMEAHPYVYIYTEEELLIYEIFAAYQFSDEHILYAHDGFEDMKVLEEYIEEILSTASRNGILKEETEVTANSCILTLSTCIAGKPDNRFLVQGVLLNGTQGRRYPQ